MAFKIYTRTGDKGTTALIGGARVSKSNIRIEAYGTVDELNSFMGWIADLSEQNESVLTEIRAIQDRLFTLGSLMASAPDKEIKMKLPEMHEDDIVFLENAIDKMNEALPEMRSFVLPGGHPASSAAHVARCVCRRAERICVSMREHEEPLPELALAYLNRLSDYLFVLSRYLIFTNNAQEIPWTPKL